MLVKKNLLFVKRFADFFVLILKVFTICNYFLRIIFTNFIQAIVSRGAKIEKGLVHVDYYQQQKIDNC